MSLSDLASIGSFVSGLAVVITLVFLLLQMQQANRNQRSLIQQGRSAKNVAGLLKQAETDMSDVLSRAYRSDLTLAPGQVRAVNAYCSLVVFGAEDSFLQHRKGTLDYEGWETDIATLKGFLALPAFRVAWLMVRHQTARDFREFIDKLMSETKPLKTWDEHAIWKNLMEKQLADAV